MKIYTGGGDKGKTSLFSGERVPKHHWRIEAYGDVDELNAVLGALIAALSPDTVVPREELCAIQSNLFELGSWLAVTPGSSMESALAAFDLRLAQGLESAIDRMDAVLPRLKSFILPGGHPAACWAHVARTVCRRCERRVTALCETTEAADGPGKMLVHLIQYLNRLSDYLFVLARYLNHTAGVCDVPWKR